MDTNRILTELRAERARIDQAISAIEAINSTGLHTTARAPRAAVTRRKRGRMSAAARRKMSLLMKQRWAEGKMKPGRKATSKPRRISQAARNRIAAAQRARWAKVRAQQKAQKKAA